MTKSINPNHPVDWNSYAAVYDLMCRHNPAYEQLLMLFEAELPKLELGKNPEVLDIGAGTGNFTEKAARIFPAGTFHHLDNNEVMNQYARDKYGQSGLSNVNIHSFDIGTFEFSAGAYDLITAFHSLYTFKNPQETIESVFSGLKAGGYFMVIDLGRLMNVKDWAFYLFKSLLKTQGLFRTLNLFIRGRKIASQNSLIRKEQELGNYWLHSTEELIVSMEKAGFEIVRKKLVYRGYSDYVLARKPLTSSS